jgi:GT2 family glycosyltransferase
LVNPDKVEIVIIAYNSYELTLNCIASIYDTAKELNFDITVVDNASTDDTIKEVGNKYPQVRIVKNERNLGYAAAINKGVRSSNSDYFIITNNDVIFLPEAIEKLISHLKKNKRNGIVGPQQQFQDGQWEYSYGDLPGISLGLKNIFFISSLNRYLQERKWEKSKIKTLPKKVAYVDGAVMAIRREAFEDTGGFDADYFFYTEEADFCHRLKKKGWAVMFLPDASVIHIRGGSSSIMGLDEEKVSSFINSKYIFCRKHKNKPVTYIYSFLEIFHNYLMIFIWNFIYLLTAKKAKQKADAKRKYYRVIAKHWAIEFRKYRYRIDN